MTVAYTTRVEEIKRGAKPTAMEKELHGILTELLDTVELNLDEIEPATREVLDRAVDLWREYMP